MFSTGSTCCLTDFIGGKFGRDHADPGNHRLFQVTADELQHWSDPYHRGHFWTPHRIFRVTNPSTFGAFVLTRMQYRIRGVSPDTLTLYHGTPRENLHSVCKKNFDRRFVRRHVYGLGVSFAANTSYVARCTYHRSAWIAIFICSVLKGDVVRRVRDLDTMDISIDTGRSADGKVYVKARDDEFMPIYVVICENTSRHTIFGRNFTPKNRESTSSHRTTDFGAAHHRNNDENLRTSFSNSSMVTHRQTIASPGYQSIRNDQVRENGLDEFIVKVITALIFACLVLYIKISSSRENSNRQW